MIVYYLSSCSTCKRILSEVSLPKDAVLIDIKSSPLNENQLSNMHKLTQSYESLFNKRAQLYKKRELHQQKLSETDYKNLLLEHYTFLKRPVFVDDKNIFIGNSKSTIDGLKNYLDDK